jgi:hypothetical protein
MGNRGTMKFQNLIEQPRSFCFHLVGQTVARRSSPPESSYIAIPGGVFVSRGEQQVIIIVMSALQFYPTLSRHVGEVDLPW